MPAKTIGGRCLRFRTLGLDIAKNQNEIRKRIGVLPQEFNTFDRLTVRESLKYYATLYDNSHSIDELLVSVDSADKAKIHSIRIFQEG